MILKLHHIGIVTQSISEFADIFRILGLNEITQPEVDLVQKVSASFITAGDVYIELLEPLGESSPIINFIKKRGAGLHHLCFEVDDINRLTNELTQNGFQVVCAPVECVGYDRSFKRECSQTSKIAFFLFSKNILIELLQKGV